MAPVPGLETTITKTRRGTVITLAGPRRSGKTVKANELEVQYLKLGRKVIRLNRNARAETIKEIMTQAMTSSFRETSLRPDQIVLIREIPDGETPEPLLFI